MQEVNELDIRLDANGNPRIQYYLAKAHRLRAEAIATGFCTFKAWLRLAVGRLGHGAHPRPPAGSLGHGRA